MDETLGDSQVLSQGLVIPAPDRSSINNFYLTKGRGEQPVFILLYLTRMAYLPLLGIFLNLVLVSSIQQSGQTIICPQSCPLFPLPT